MKEAKAIADEILPKPTSYFILGEIIEIIDDNFVKLKIVSIGPKAFTEEFMKSYSKEHGVEVYIKNGADILGKTFKFLVSIIHVSHRFKLKEKLYCIFSDEQFLKKVCGVCGLGGAD